MSGVPIRSVQFLVVLGVAVIVGWLVGSWLGSVGKEPNVTPSPSVPAGPVESPSPSVAPSPASATPAPPGSTILEVSGTADLKSESFTVMPGWQIVWQTEGGGFAIALRGDRDLGTIVDQDGTASGATSLPTAGTFHLEVTAKGPWSLKVIQGEAPPTPTPSETPS